MIWVIYGLPMVHPDSTLVVTINGAGTAIEVVLLTLFLIFCHDKRKRRKVLLIVLVELFFIAVVTTLVLTVVHTTERRSMVVGIIAILFNIMMYASPLSVMVSIIEFRYPKTGECNCKYHFNYLLKEMHALAFILLLFFEYGWTTVYILISRICYCFTI